MIELLAYSILAGVFGATLIALNVGENIVVLYFMALGSVTACIGMAIGRRRYRNKRRSSK